LIFEVTFHLLLILLKLGKAWLPIITTIFSNLGPPDPPKNVQLCDWDSDHMDLVWDYPPKDGGAKVTHYLIEMRIGKPGASWEEVGKSDGPAR
jgi:hypothetical protein